MVRYYLIILIVLLFNPIVLYALPAFPGAEGFGSAAVGGRGGTVYIIDTLSDDPDDGVTFREACTASGARYIVFAVSGDIHLLTDLSILNPNITIAGQTSPGGISVSGGMFWVGTNNVIITHMHFRRGTDLCPSLDCSGGYGDAVRIMNNGAADCYDVIMDHCSLAWGADETLDISGYLGDTYDITVSNCIIAQGCDNTSGGDDVTNMDTNHALGVVISGAYQDSTDVTCSFHHNYIAHFRYRFPNTTGAKVDMYNNVIYNWQQYVANHDVNLHEATLGALNIRHCYYKQGPSVGEYDDCDSNPGKSQGHVYDQTGENGIMTGTPEGFVYTLGNIGTCYPNAATRNGKYWNGYDGTSQELAAGWLASSFIGTATNGDATVTTMTITYASQVVAAAGANRIGSTTDITYDSLDTTLIANYTAGEGSWIDYTSYPTGWPTYSTANDNPTDSDSDGMWDTTETTVFGDLSKDGTADTDGDGYKDFEEYLFYLGGYTQTASPTPTCQGISVQ